MWVAKLKVRPDNSLNYNKLILPLSNLAKIAKFIFLSSLKYVCLNSAHIKPKQNEVIKSCCEFCKDICQYNFTCFHQGVFELRLKSLAANILLIPRGFSKSNLSKITFPTTKFSFELFSVRTIWQPPLKLGMKLIMLTPALEPFVRVLIQLQSDKINKT